MSKDRSILRNRAEFAAFRAARTLTGALPSRAVAWLGGALGTLFSLAGGRRREIIDFNLKLAYPGSNEAERRTLARAVACHFARSALDAVRLQSLQPAELLASVEIDGWDHVDGAIAGGRGAFFLTAHLGSWEVAALVTGLKLAGGLSVVNRPLDNPFLEGELDRLRKQYGNRVFGKHNIAREMLRQLKQGGGVGILIDQRVGEDVGVAVPFFGHPAWTHPVLARVARKTGAPVVPTFAIRQGAGRYALRYEAPILVDELAAAEREDEALTARFLGILEVAIRKNPDQWLWYHDRWRQLRVAN